MSKIKKLKRINFCFDSQNLKTKINKNGVTYIRKVLHYYNGNIILYMEYKANKSLKFNMSGNNFSAIVSYIRYLEYCKRRNIIDDRLNYQKKDRLKRIYQARDMHLNEISSFNELINDKLLVLWFNYV